MIYNIASKVLYAWNVSGILNLCINSGKDTIVVRGPENRGKISEYFCMNSQQDIIVSGDEDNISTYEMGPCYITGFKNKSRFEHEIPVIKEIFKKPGVIQFRYWGYWIPGLGMYKKIYYINAMTD